MGFFSQWRLCNQTKGSDVGIKIQPAQGARERFLRESFYGVQCSLLEREVHVLPKPILPGINLIEGQRTKFKV